MDTTYPHSELSSPFLSSFNVDVHSSIFRPRVDPPVANKMLHPVVIHYLIMLCNRSTRTSTASHRFDAKKSDFLVLKSSDGVTISVQKKILSMVTDSFGNRVDFEDQTALIRSSTSRPTRGPKDGDVIHVQESSETIETLFQFLYPVSDPTLDTIEENIVILEAAKKYGMTFPLKRIRKQLEAKAKNNPLRVYAIALSDFEARVRLKDEIQMAAKSSLMHSLDPWTDSPLTEFEHISGGDYIRLLTYRRECEYAVSALFTESTEGNVSVYSSSFLHECFDPSASWLFDPASGFDWHYSKSRVKILLRNSRSNWYDQGTTPPEIHATRWFVDWMVKAMGRLRKQPHPAALSKESFMELFVQASSLQGHQKNIPEVMARFEKVFIKAIDEAVDQVELDIRSN
ncbi:hypothetical protein BDY19DRAFT_960741 [Irpex rosettiformis]|uniref:Uncharacterized protein n=1 Tax=Irpex rosettiformis TaxID=378272 RepID=A0ACB8TWE2_9APHY|nr:hypothetical protein BDY19DRAFT_960741 [Irpex rosettiformis]